jgi:hypothetical protein
MIADGRRLPEDIEHPGGGSRREVWGDSKAARGREDQETQSEEER